MSDRSPPPNTMGSEDGSPPLKPSVGPIGSEPGNSRRSAPKRSASVAPRRSLAPLSRRAPSEPALAKPRLFPTMPSTGDQEAVLRRATAASDFAREERHVEELTEDLAKIPGETPVLDQVREIRALESHYAGALAARQDRPDQEANAAAARLDILTAQRDLGLAVEPDELSARIPTELARNAIRRLARDRAAIDHSLTDRKGRLALARSAYENAKKAFESAVPLADPAPLRKILEAVKAEGRLDGDLEAAEEEAVGARRTSTARWQPCRCGRAMLPSLPPLQSPTRRPSRGSTRPSGRRCNAWRQRGPG